MGLQEFVVILQTALALLAEVVSKSGEI